MGRGTIGVILILAGLAGAAEPLSWGEALSALSSPDRAQRRAALTTLAEGRETTGRTIVDALAARSEEVGELIPYEGELHSLIRAAGELRLEAAVPRLLELAAVNIDLATVPPFHNCFGGAEYPAANALAKISSPELAPRLVSALAASEDELRRRAFAWVLCEILGRDAALATLRAAHATAGATAKPRLAEAIGWLEGEAPILERGK